MSGRSSGSAGVYTDGTTIAGANTSVSPLYINRDTLVQGVPSSGAAEATDEFYVYDPETGLAKRVTVSSSGIAASAYDAFTVLAADADNTPLPLTMGASTLLARLASGGIVAATPLQIRTLLDQRPAFDVYEFDGSSTTSPGTNRMNIAGATFNPFAYVMPFAGKVIGVSVTQHQACTAGAAEYKAYINGSATSPLVSAIINTTNPSRVYSMGGSTAFAVGATLDCYQVVASYTGSAAQVKIRVYVQYDVV